MPNINKLLQNNFSKILFVLLPLTLFKFNLSGQTGILPYNGDGRNSVQTILYDINGNVIGQSISYSDLLGRPTQSLSRNMSASTVMVSQSIYDALGRPVISTLAAPVSKNDLDYVKDFVTNASGSEYGFSDFEGKGANPNPMYGKLASYYSNNNFLEPYVPVSAYPYTRVEYSKLQPGVTRKTAAAGELHRMGSGHESQSYSMAIPEEELGNYKSYFSSLTGVKLETKGVTKTVSVDPDGVAGVVYTSADGQVISSCYPDESAEERTITINSFAGGDYFDIHLNKAGTVSFNGCSAYIYDLTTDQLLSEDYQSGAVSLDKGFYRLVMSPEMTTNSFFTYKVYYKGHSFNFYDNAGRLIYSISPQSFLDWKDKETSKTEANFLKYASYNLYNSLGWLYSSQSPDEGITNYRYAQDGKIRYSQNAKQKDLGVFSYTNYDYLNRPVESGECSPKENNTLTFSTVFVSENISETYWILNDWTRTYYDEIDAPATYNGSAQNYTIGRVAKTENASSATYYSYTYDGKTEWIVQDIAGLGRKTIEYVYTDDLIGNLKSVIYQKGQSDQFTHHYLYDADNRLEYVKTQAGTEAAKTQAHYIYYTHGPLKRVEIAENLQGIDYVYNINGLLKSINHPDLTVAGDPGGDGTGGTHPGFGSDLFGMSLDYYSGDYAHNGVNIPAAAGMTSRYNGNIAASTWKNKKSSISQGKYVYTYNNRNWLTEARFGDETAYGEKIKGYDENGNITGLTRYASSRIDELTYNYTPGLPNQLQSVKDDEPQTAIAGDIRDQASDNYKYNLIGQLTDNKSDNQKFTYDVYGHVTAIHDFAGNLLAGYTYDDRGFRIKKTSQGTTTWYVRDATGQILATYLQDGSDIRLNEVNLYGSSRFGLALAGTSGTIDRYMYEIADHLGNVRVTFSRNSEGIRYTETLEEKLIGAKSITAGNSITLLPGFSTNGKAFSATIDPAVTSDGMNSLLSAADYYPFGMEMPGRNYQGSDEYRYGYQGQYSEKDESGYNHFEARDYDPRIGRWMIPDPARQYYSLYLGMGNNPVNGVDPDGSFKYWIGAFFYKIRFGGEIKKAKDGQHKGEWFVGQQLYEANQEGAVYERKFKDDSHFFVSGQARIDYGLTVGFEAKLLGAKLGGYTAYETKPLGEMGFEYIPDAKKGEKFTAYCYDIITTRGILESKYINTEYSLGFGVVEVNEKFDIHKRNTVLGPVISQSYSVPFWGTRGVELDPNNGRIKEDVASWGVGANGGLGLVGFKVNLEFGWKRQR